MLRRFFTSSTVRKMSTTRPNVTQIVQNSMQKLFPLELADRSWDNVGLLLESPIQRPRIASVKPKVLLTIDLTNAVTNEALEENSGVEAIVTYHPIIFRGLKSLTLADTQQKSLLRLCAAGIGVYSPHTSVDGAIGGVNDWLADVIADGEKINIKSIVPAPPVEGHEEGGYGRIVTFPSNIQLQDLVSRIKRGLGLSQVQLGRPKPDKDIRTVALCAGSGGSVFKSLPKDIDALFTGELSHHEVLAAVENDKYVILCGHSNTERGYLAVLQRKLQSHLDEDYMESEIEVIRSRVDSDPLEMI